ncbi:MAG: GntR family transcriptional regulator [Alsobacter sp.]
MARQKAKSRQETDEDRGSDRGPLPVEDEIYALITQGIVTKRIRPGARLKEAALAKQFDVSRMRVRRVLQRLADLSVVEFRLNYGAVVARPSAVESRAVFQTRRLLEAEAIRALTEAQSKGAFQRLRAAIAEEERAFASGAPDASALSSRFHLLLGDASGNPVLADILNQLVHRCVLIQSLYETSFAPALCLLEEHIRILDLMERGQVAAAQREMADHLSHIEASLNYDGGARTDDRLEAALD